MNPSSRSRHERTARPHPGRTAGFTLLELMIVVGVIAILAAMAIPRLLEAKYGAYETGAHTYLRAIHQAEVQYRSTTGCWGALADLRRANLLASTNPTCYTVIVTVLRADGGFTAVATPIVRADEMRHFFVDGSGVVRYSSGAPADETSTPL